MSVYDRITAALAALSSPTPKEAKLALGRFGVRDVVASYIAQGGGGGGSQTGASRWIGPCKINCFGSQDIAASSGSVAGGTYTLTHDGDETAPIAWDASPAQIAAALEALPSIPAGSVTVDPTHADINSDIYVLIAEAAAVELLTVDGANLTGPDAPYSFTVAAGGTGLFPLLTPAVGDIIEDFAHATVTAYAEGTPKLIYTDNPADPTENGPGWANPTNAQGVDGLVLNSSSDEFANFWGHTGAGIDSQPTSLLALIAQWAASGGSDLYGNLPAVCRISAPLYSFVRDVDSSPTAGEVWVWVKIATPAGMDA